MEIQIQIGPRAPFEVLFGHVVALQHYVPYVPEAIFIKFRPNPSKLSSQTTADLHQLPF